MANAKNIIPPKKGEVRNPKGKPKGTLNRATLLARWLEAEQSGKNPITGKDERLSQADMIVLAQIKAARQGDLKAAEWLFDGWVGKMADKTEMQVKSTSNAKVKLKIPDDPVKVREMLLNKLKAL